MQFKLPLLFCALFAAGFFITLNVEAQSGSQTQYMVPQLFPRSPSSTVFEKYGTYQVNEFTGIPDISIPLYTVEAGGLKVPITLSYHASGNKISDVASWAGLGWSVSVGGQISRRIMGVADDDANGYLNGSMWQVSSIDPTTSAGVHYLENSSKGLNDTKPDIYSYDFPGHSGKFFFDGSPGGNFTPRMLPFSPIKITYKNIHFFSTNPPPNTGLKWFKIADEHGNNYTFGDSWIETTESSSAGIPSTIPYGTAWKLENIISQNRRDTISFTYQGDQVDYPMADSEIFTVIDQILSLPGGYEYSNPSYSTTPTTPGNSSVVNELLPQQINFKNGKVVFEVDTRTDIGGTYGLYDIKVYKYNYGTKAMELQKTVVFYKSYFLTNGTNQRLRLDSIQILDKAGSIKQHYRFDYNTHISLPGYTSYAQDYWGYYNGCDSTRGGKQINTMLTPQQTVSYQPYTINPVTYVTIGQANRNSDSTYMQAFVLTGIHYPTGGYSTFTYQTNQYVQGGVLYQAGGLRIKSISSYDGINPIPVVKTYVYNNNAARPNFFLDYCYFMNWQTHRYYTAPGGAVNSSLEMVRTFSSSPHCDLEGYDGATVVYPSVTEYIGTAGNNIGRTDYTFRDQPDSFIDASYAGSLIYESAFYARGQLAYKKEWIHKTDGTYQPVKLTYNSYTAFPQTKYNHVGLVVKKMNYNEGLAGANPFEPSAATPDDHQSFMYDDYWITSDDNYLTGTTTTVYDTNDTTKRLVSSVTYKYDNIAHQQVTRTYSTNSQGNTQAARTKYPADYPAGNAIIDSMVNRNMQAEAIEKYDTLKNVSTSVNAIVSGQLNQYKNGSIPFTIVPSKISTLSVLQPLTNFTPSTVTSGNLTGDSRYVQMISFDQYDAQNNPIQFTPRNATPTSIVWNYQYEQPVAQVKNATTSYGSLTQIAYTSFEGDNRGNWYYTGTPVYNPSAPSGVMVYSLSSGSISFNGSLDNTKSYILSYWSNNGTATVYAGSYLTGTSMTTVNGWTYYEYTVPSGTTAITISGTTTIDELRLYPTASQMITYAYDPTGVVDISDAKGLNTSFEYDFAQRLKNTRDFYGNITASYGYHMYDQTIGNQAQSGTFTRNNCPPNTTPGSLTYSVPANKYYSSTLASANADAVYDKNLNGQIKANTNCGCPQIMVSFTLSNSSGLTGYQATFSGIATPYNFPSTGTTVIQVPQGTYNTISVNAVGSGTHNFSLTGQVSQNGVHYATFNNVPVTTGSNLTLSVQ
ncbi:MAG TPA: DUF5977 domain-containing protein [Mucilaginibacter sp.]|jgi:hypothetical protein|nr:DUF5977 domain-containing protein [Mucilaginibacter sp.]